MSSTDKGLLLDTNVSHTWYRMQGCVLPTGVYKKLTGNPVGVVAVVVVVQAQRQELKCSRLAPGYFTLIGDKAPPAARDSSEVARS